MTPLRVRATVNLPGLSAGEETMADSDSAYIKRMLAASFLETVQEHTSHHVREPEPELELEAGQADDPSNLNDDISPAQVAETAEPMTMEDA